MILTIGVDVWENVFVIDGIPQDWIEECYSTGELGLPEVLSIPPGVYVVVGEYLEMDKGEAAEFKVESITQLQIGGFVE